MCDENDRRLEKIETVYSMDCLTSVIVILDENTVARQVLNNYKGLLHKCNKKM